jgi:hypothetical protein
MVRDRRCETCDMHAPVLRQNAEDLAMHHRGRKVTVICRLSTKNSRQLWLPLILNQTGK